MHRLNPIIVLLERERSRTPLECRLLPLAGSLDQRLSRSDNARFVQRVAFFQFLTEVTWPFLSASPFPASSLISFAAIRPQSRTLYFWAARQLRVGVGLRGGSPAMRYKGSRCQPMQAWAWTLRLWPGRWNNLRRLTSTPSVR